MQLDPDGVLLLVDIDQIAAIDEDTAVSYAQEAMASSNDRGFISTYRYLKRSSQDGTSIIFLDCGRNLSTLRAFFLLSILGGLGGFLLTFLVVLLLSGRILKPVAESYSRQKRFITDAGHEIKTPLTIIGADTTLLEMEWGENEWLTDIQKPDHAPYRADKRTNLSVKDGRRPSDSPDRFPAVGSPLPCRRNDLFRLRYLCLPLLPKRKEVFYEPPKNFMERLILSLDWPRSICWP